MKKVMISYSHDDTDFIHVMDAKLQDQGINAWLDERDITPGFPWRDAIFQAIIDCEYMIICLSPAYIASQMCRMEVYLARCYGKKILPIMIKTECWDLLQKHHEMAGIEDLLVLNFVNNKTFGLLLDEKKLFTQLVNSILNENIERKKPSAYVSYRASDAKYATKISDDLSEQGIETWIATRSYMVGEDCTKSQWEALMHTKVLIVILSEDVPDSLMIQNEILVAITRKIPILPVLVEPPKSKKDVDFTRSINEKLTLKNSFEMKWLSDIHWFYPNKPDYSTMLEKLKNTITKFD